MRTLKEQCLWLHRFESLDQAGAIIGAFIERYHREWLIEPLHYRTPAAARQELAMAAELSDSAVQEIGCATRAVGSRRFQISTVTGTSAYVAHED